MAWFTCVEVEATTSVSNVPFCTNRGPTAWHPYTHPLICVEGNRCLLTGFQYGEVSTPALSPFLPQDPELPWLPKRLQAKTTPRRSPFPRKQISILSAMCTRGFQSRPPLTAALCFRICGALFSVSESRSRSRVPYTVPQRLEPLEAHAPASDTASRRGLPSPAGSKPLEGRHLSGPISVPTHVWSGARGPEHTNAKSSGRASEQAFLPLSPTPFTNTPT